MSYVGPTEATWERHVDNDPPHFVFARGKHGPWKYWQRDGGNEWSESEMQAVDSVMQRCCDIDRAHWTFDRYTDDHHTAHFAASSPTWQFPGMLSQTLSEFLYRLEAEWNGNALLAGGWHDEQGHCKFCDALIRDQERPEGMARWEIIPHCEEQHPEELARVRAERLARMERLRDYFRARDERYHVEIDGPREPRRFIL